MPRGQVFGPTALGVQAVNAALTGTPLTRIWTDASLPWLLVPAACLLAALVYGGAVLRLRRRGDAWPTGRIVAFAFGLVCVCAVTGTGIGGYGMELLSVTWSST